MRRRFGYSTKTYLWKENPWRFKRLLPGTAAFSAARTGLIHVREQSPGSPQQGQAAHLSAGHRAVPGSAQSRLEPPQPCLDPPLWEAVLSPSCSSIQSWGSGWGAETTPLGQHQGAPSHRQHFQAHKHLPAAPPRPGSKSEGLTGQSLPASWGASSPHEDRQQEDVLPEAPSTRQAARWLLLMQTRARGQRPRTGMDSGPSSCQPRGRAAVHTQFWPLMMNN